MSQCFYQDRTMREKRLARKQWFFSTSCRFFLVGLTVLFGVLFIWKTSTASTKGYELNDYEKQINSLEQENQRLQLQIAEIQSLKNIEKRIPELGMVVADSAEYALLTGSSVALR